MAKTERTERVNLSTAGAEELERIEGIDSARAQHILEHRSRHGPFRSWEEFDAVAGIGPVLLEKAKEAAVLGGDGASAPEQGSRPAAGRDSEADDEEIAVEISPAELLSSLARLDLEAALAYETAAELSAEPDVARQLRVFANDHRRHLDALNRILAREGEPSVTVIGGAVPVLPGIMKLAGPLGPEVIVVALLGNEQLTNLSYDGALAYQWDHDLEAMLQGFAADEQRHLTWLVDRHDRVSRHAPPSPGAHPA